MLKKENYNILGLMIESNLEEGKQKLVFGEKHKLEWGKSITDCCIGLTETTDLLNSFYYALSNEYC